MSGNKPDVDPLGRESIEMRWRVFFFLHALRVCISLWKWAERHPRLNRAIGVLLSLATWLALAYVLSNFF
jgi:hypothetical protein